MLTEIDWTQFFNVSNLITFGVGILFGLITAGLFYMLLVLRSIRMEASLRLPKHTSRLDGIHLIDSAKKKYSQEKKFKSYEERFVLTKEIAMELAEDIAKFHFPQSKNPYLEISAYELLEATKYIIERIESILNKKPLRRLKNLSGVQILTMFEWKSKISEHKAVKKLVKINKSPVVKAAKHVYSAISPTYFIRRSLINTTVMFSVDALNKVVLNIVGEEFYKLYSKELFRMDDTYDLIEGIEIDEEE